ncbi:D-beta-hydroxybutyrate dehydrogenase, mitochondrial-like isoform X2 [Ostrea edulis]|uniref:D-beta-hydroxybutyrate dehydrogenase, mitochondrial-like isoform X2 n=1 Tax=Ostrea edulis TaxID=37623 RepID=UPI0024AEABE0|nr:D-beta-hydroxybutyrate dehydrogenase, mitochondrial-like isoform X2 [Ostrea edulis]
MWPVIVFGVLVFVLWYLYDFHASKTRKIPVHGQGVLITGCDTGFGHYLAKRLDEMEFRVFAGCLEKNGVGAAELMKSCSDRLSVVQLDVTKDDQIKDARNCIEKVHRDTGCGRVINCTSVKGRLSLPRISVYGITKYGGENFSDCLRLEMRKFGVKVVIVEPGEFGGVTGLLKGNNLKRLKNEMDRMWNQADPEVKQVYGRKYLESQFSSLDKAGDTSPCSVEPVIDAFIDAVTLENPKPRYLVDGGTGLIDKYCFYARLNRYLPTPWMDFLIDRWFNSLGTTNIGT